MEVGAPVARAIRYRQWPLPLLRLAGRLLAPVAQSKAHGAREAASFRVRLADEQGYDHPWNAVGTYTDLELASACFGDEVLRAALASRHDLEREQLGSKELFEKLHTILMLSDFYDTCALDYQIGEGCQQEIRFPFLDQAFIRSMFSIESAARYFGGKMTKHLPKRVLMARVKGYDVRKPYLGTGFQDDLFRWMREGELRDLVASIERPAYLGRVQFDQALREPSWFTWNLLTLDLFQKRVLSAH
jgi:hypothetical protein